MGLRKDGLTFPIEITGKAIPYQGRTVRVAALRDITERKQLEAQIQEALERRGYQVQISTEISQEVAAASELSDLFDRVVTLTKERLGYYHTQLLRYDAARDAVVLINGYGETGKKMLAGGHQMPMGSGLIGTAAASGETVLRPVLSDDPDWHPNPLLPNTQGEIAVPIKWKDTVLGVLDVQSDRANALSDDDRLLLEGLCGQIAIAMQSAELVKTIRENEARLAEALRAARLANWEYDVEKDIFTFNDQFYSIFHTTAEKAGGYQLSSARYAELFVHPDDMEVVGTEIGKALSSTERVYNTTIDHRIRYEDGGIGYITVQLTVERDENGKITRYYGANQDITERKQAEEALRVNEARLAEALRAARLGNWEYDFEHDLFIFTDDFYSIFRTTAEKVGGYKISSADYSKNFVHPDDAALVGIEIQRVLDAKDRLFTTHLEHRIIFADGEVGYIAVNINVERDENGNITRWYGANQDITERRRAEEALRVNEARLAEALKTAHLANWEYDVEKDFFTFNDQFYSIFHTTAKKVGGYQLTSARYAELFVHPDDMEVVGAEIGKALSSTERVYNTSIDHRILYADGGIGYITVKLTVERDENGKITRYYGANQDITERKQAEEALAERLEEINRLYQNLSHEGWKTYRATEDLPEGFVFDQTGTKPVSDETVLADGQFASVPMKVLGGEAIGTLEVADDPQHPRSPEDYVFLQQVSEQIALALEGARLAAQTQSALAQSEKLFEASRTLTQATDLQELTSSTVTMLGVQEINRAIMATFNYDPEGNIESLDIIANWSNGTGHEVTAIGTHYPLSVIRAMSFFVSPTPVFFNDTHTDERVDATTMKLVQNLNLRSVAVLPLHTGTRQIGALILEGEEPHTFTDDETRLFSALAPQISTVLENRRQFERAQQQAERESTLNIISQKIQSATTVEAVLQIAARELGHALGAPMTIAQLSMKDKK
jgi:PAS domain S-box-containing protein